MVLKAAHEVPFTLPDEGNRKSQVWLVGLGESSLNFELLVWPTLEAVKRPAAMQAAYTWAIEDALRCAGIEMPFPQVDVHLRDLFGLQNEAAREGAEPRAGRDEAGVRRAAAALGDQRRRRRSDERRRRRRRAADAPTAGE